MQFWTKDDGFIGGLYKVVAISALIFGVWAYFNTVHPVFEKESELLTSKLELKQLKEKGLNLSKEVSQRESELSELKQKLLLEREQLEHVQRFAERKAEESQILEEKIGFLNHSLANTRKESVRTIISGVLDDISREYLEKYIAEKYHGKKSNFDLKTYTLNMASERLKKATKGGVEHAAFSVLKLFAEEKLEDGINDYQPIFDVILFAQFNEAALLITNSNTPAP